MKCPMKNLLSLLVAVLFISCSDDDGPAPAQTALVTFSVNGSANDYTVTYTDHDGGQTRVEDADNLWSMTLQFESGDVVLMTAASNQQEGTVRASIQVEDQDEVFSFHDGPFANVMVIQSVRP